MKKIKIVNTKKKTTTPKRKKNSETLCKATLKLNIIKNPDDKQYYFRIHELCNFLEVKQPFEFTALVKRALGSEFILKGDEAAFMRDSLIDNSRTTFVNVDSVYEILTNPTFLKKNRMNLKRRDELLNKLTPYVC